MIIFELTSPEKHDQLKNTIIKLLICIDISFNFINIPEKVKYNSAHLKHCLPLPIAPSDKPIKEHSQKKRTLLI